MLCFPWTIDLDVSPCLQYRLAAVSLEQSSLVGPVKVSIDTVSNCRIAWPCLFGENRLIDRRDLKQMHYHLVATREKQTDKP